MLSRRFISTSRKPFAFAFDIDGVLLRSKSPIPGASEGLKLLHKHKVPFILLTNGGGHLEKDRTSFISDALDVPISPAQIVQSHTPYKSLTSKYNKILAVGTPSVRKVAESYGFKDVVHQTDIIRYDRSITPFSGLNDQQLQEYSKDKANLEEKPFDAVLVFNDPHDWAADLQIINDLLITQNGRLGTLRDSPSQKPSIPIYFSNQDLLWANAYKLNRFGQGAFRFLVRELYSKMNDGMALEDMCLGKPTKLTYDFAHHVLIDWNKKLEAGQTDSSEINLPQLGTPVSESPFTDVFMVGDNPASDIIGAQNYGWSSFLVKTGVYREGDNLKHVKPTHIVKDVRVAVETVLEKYL